MTYYVLLELESVLEMFGISDEVTKKEYFLNNLPPAAAQTYNVAKQI